MAAPAELTIPPDTRYVGLARLVVCAAARQAGLDEERTEDLRIAVSEATTNAILSHQRNDADDSVCLSFGVSQEGAFEVTVADCGPGFEPVESFDPDERDWEAESGLGVTIIRGLTDEVEFVRGDGMSVQLRFAVALDGNGNGNMRDD
jgi:serine/threonine-protein kinase RsbW